MSNKGMKLRKDDKKGEKGDMMLQPNTNKLIWKLE